MESFVRGLIIAVYKEPYNDRLKGVLKSPFLRFLNRL